MDLDTGNCVFCLYPYRKHPLQDAKGSVRCEGIIIPEAEGTPVEALGDVKGKTFVVRDMTISNELVRFFHFAAEDLTDAQLERLADAVMGQDLTEFFKSPDASVRLSDALKRVQNRDAIIKAVMEKGTEFAFRRDIVSAFKPYGISYGAMWSIIQSGLTLDRIAADPYGILVRHGVPLATADKYAKQCGYGEYSLCRFKAFVSDGIRRAYKNGNSCIRFRDLARLVNISPVLTAFCVSEMKEYRFSEVDKEMYVYTQKAWEEETRAIEHILRLNSAKSEKRKVDIAAVEQKTGMRYNEEQRRTFSALETPGIKIITGPPGTGKTTTARGLVEAFRLIGGKIRLAAVTGKAAEVLTEACGTEPATTVHSLLNKAADADLIIVDETSMMGLEIFSLLVSSIKDGAVLILMGDENQLPSVDYGNVLADLVGLVETYRLKKAMRSEDEIAAAADNILRGRVPKNSKAFAVYECRNEKEAMELVKKYWHDAQILSSVKEGMLGCRELNRAFQITKRRTGRFVACGGQKFYAGDLVLFGRNNYSLGYLNGDLGIVTRVFGDGLSVKKKDSTVTLAFNDMHDLDLGYALTVHKAQGSEYDNVLLILPGPCTRKLLFTAVSRAKKKITIISVNGAFGCAREEARTTLLATRAKEKKNGRLD